MLWVASWKSSTVASRSVHETWPRRPTRSHADDCSTWPSGTTPKANPAAPGRYRRRGPAHPRPSSPAPEKHEEGAGAQRSAPNIGRRWRPCQAAESFPAATQVRRQGAPTRATRRAVPRRARDTSLHPARRRVFDVHETARSRSLSPFLGAAKLRGRPIKYPCISSHPSCRRSAI